MGVFWARLKPYGDLYLWAYDGPVQSVVVVRSYMALLRPEDVKGSAPSGPVSTMPNQGSKSY